MTILKRSAALDDSESAKGMNIITTCAKKRTISPYNNLELISVVNSSVRQSCHQQQKIRYNYSVFSVLTDEDDL